MATFTCVKNQLFFLFDFLILHGYMGDVWTDYPVKFARRTLTSKLLINRWTTNTFGKHGQHQKKAVILAPPPYPNPPHNLATHLTKHTYIHILASNIFYFQERYKNIFTLKKNFQVKRVFLGEGGGGVTGKEWTSTPPLKILGSALGDIHIHCSSYTTKYLQSRQRSN